MKTAGMILLVISCSGLGFHMAGLYGRRIAECVRIERLLMRLGGEIRFCQTPLAEALRAAGGERTDGFSCFFSNLSGRLEESGGEFGSLWEEELMGYLADSLLREEAELLFYLGRQLGNLDLEAQQKALNRFLEQWQEHIRELRSRQESRTRLYRCLGVSAGVFLAILFL
jgi:stage III sporulation protein AB